jgi:cytidylate kinase
MTASANTRAKDVMMNLWKKEIMFEEVLKNVEERDYIDTHRDNSSIRAEDAIEIDNSYLSREEQF